MKYPHPPFQKNSVLPFVYDLLSSQFRQCTSQGEGSDQEKLYAKYIILFGFFPAFQRTIICI